MKIKRNILLNPGPATTTDTVKKSMIIPDICPREKEFCSIMQEVRKDLINVVHGDNNYTSILFAGSGTAVMDACINSVVPENKKIAIINNGAYGARMVQIAQAYTIDYVEIKVEWNKKPDSNEIENILKSDKDIACLSMVHHETTTGILNPIKEIGKIVAKYNCVFIVDAISSYAAIPINIKEYNIDFLMSTSNKCIQGMAGLSFVICPKDELEKTKDYMKRSYYLNLYKQYNSFEKTGQMQFTPPVQIAYSLKQALLEYFREGETNRYERYTQSWKVLRNGLLDMGFKLLLKEEEESHILLTVIEPDISEFNFEKMHDLLYKNGFTIYPGKVSFEKTFRLANMGAIDKNDIENFLNCLKNVLSEMNIKLK